MMHSCPLFCMNSLFSQCQDCNPFTEAGSLAPSRVRKDAADQPLVTVVSDVSTIQHSCIGPENTNYLLLSSSVTEDR